jgi:hypothetical protein
MKNREGVLRIFCPNEKRLGWADWSLPAKDCQRSCVR